MIEILVISPVCLASPLLSRAQTKFPQPSPEGGRGVPAVPLVAGGGWCYTLLHIDWVGGCVRDIWPVSPARLAELNTATEPQSISQLVFSLTVW